MGVGAVSVAQVSVAQFAAVCHIKEDHTLHILVGHPDGVGVQELDSWYGRNQVPGLGGELAGLKLVLWCGLVAYKVEGWLCGPADAGHSRLDRDGAAQRTAFGAQAVGRGV